MGFLIPKIFCLFILFYSAFSQKRKVILKTCTKKHTPPRVDLSDRPPMVVSLLAVLQEIRLELVAQIFLLKNLIPKELKCGLNFMEDSVMTRHII